MNVHLDVRPLLLLPEGQSAQDVEESADLLWCEVVHVVQDSLYQVLCSVENSTKHNETNPLQEYTRDCHLHAAGRYIYCA